MATAPMPAARIVSAVMAAPRPVAPGRQRLPCARPFAEQRVAGSVAARRKTAANRDCPGHDRRRAAARCHYQGDCRPPRRRPGVPRVQHRHRILVDEPPAGFAVERRAQRPVARQQRQVEAVAVQQFAPGPFAPTAAGDSRCRWPDRRNRCARRRTRAAADRGGRSDSPPNWS